MNIKQTGFIALFVTLLSSGAFAQLSENSPLSSLGIGDLAEPSVVSSNTLGGLFSTYSNPYNVNLVNPASYAGLMATAFDMGVDASYTTIKDSQKEQSAWGGNFKYLSLSFPLMSPVNVVLDRKEQLFKMGMNISLLPISRMDYRINQEITTDFEDAVSRQYGGNGGLNKLQIGTGAKYKNLSMGFNIGFLFGSIQNERALLFDAANNNYHTYTENERLYSGFLWNAGLQYKWFLNKDSGDPTNNRWIAFGLYGNSKQAVSVDQTEIVLRKSTSYFGLDDENANDELIDTISINQTDNIRNYLPSEIGFGISYGLANRLQAGINIEYNGWKNFNNFLNIGTLRNSWSSAASIEYTPNPSALLNYWQRVSYRGSLYFNNDPRVFNEMGLTKKGMQVGLGFPIFQKRQLAYFNVSFDAGQLGNEIFKENYIRFNIGVTLNNNLWFYKRRFE
ncbi:hypothetical protein [Membranihabitans maritimus]|uniref:hypothetical protein n=1 Tax=Membranihabitans maritimus TaxID=2904244 RepID=UPI001F23784A|nr:hypothetical protein [Membranihabitans maritimus]